MDSIVSMPFSEEGRRRYDHIRWEPLVTKVTKLIPLELQCSHCQILYFRNIEAGETIIEGHNCPACRRVQESRKAIGIEEYQE